MCFCRKVTESVLRVSRHIARDTSNPCWTYCLPILHFLQGKCVPYEEASSKVNHESAKPEWWGIAEYGDDIDFFKGKTFPWDRYLFLQYSSPYFFTGTL